MITKAFWDYIKKNPIFKPNEVTSFGIKRTELERLVISGKILKIGRGLYSNKDREFTENMMVLELMKRMPSAVLSHLSALQFHGVTTQNPHGVWVTVKNRTWIPRIENPDVNITRVNERIYARDIEIHKIDGMDIKIYSLARTCADCFKFRNKVGIDVAIEALKEIIRKRKATIDELTVAAKYCRVVRIIRPYLEAIIAS
jgi:predicted transcriptional regulator of viral defense system